MTIGTGENIGEKCPGTIVEDHVTDNRFETVCVLTTWTSSSVTIFTVGTSPTDMEACLFPLKLEKLSAVGFKAEFIVHLADIRDGKP